MVKDTVLGRGLVGGAGVVLFAAELLEGLALGLGNEESREAAAKHEGGIDLENVIQPRVGVGRSGAPGSEGSDSTLPLRVRIPSFFLFLSGMR